MKKGLGLKLLALAAVVAAVAFSGVLTTQTADAVLTSDDADGTVAPGATVQVSTSATVGLASGDYTNWTIDVTGSAEATFVASGTGMLTCQDAQPNASACDSNGTATEMTVAVKIADDSGTGAVLIRATKFGGSQTETDLIVLNVNPGLTPVSIAASASADAITHDNDPTTSTSVITATLTNSTGGGVNEHAVVIFTTLGVLAGCGDASGTVQACSENTATIDDGDALTTDDSGKVQVTLQGNGRAGVATVTFTSGDLSTSVDVVLYGDADSITAEVQQSSIAIGGSTYIVVTAVDAGGNPVVGHEVNVAASETSGPDGVDGPAEDANEIDVINNRDFDADGDRAVDMGDLPACGNQGDTDHQVDVDGTATSTNLQANAADVGAGTNATGMCVLRVDAPADDMNTSTRDESTTRGTHTVTIGGPAADGSKNISVAIQVGGAPTSISSDAPASVEPLSATEITITVLDDEGVPVGAVDASVDQVEGAGKVLDPQVTGTSDGTASFTYLAPSSSGTAVFRVTAGSGDGQIATSIVVVIGDPAAEAPDAISIDLRAGGRIVAVTSSGPATTASALFGDAVNSAWKYNQDTGVWDVVYIPGRSGNFSINTGDILYVDSPIDQTVGG